MKTVRIGELVKVDNQQRKNGANAEYYHVIVKGGSGPFKLLFTKTELDTANDRAVKNWEDTLERSFISKMID
jgi:hypothetical protein